MPEYIYIAIPKKMLGPIKYKYLGGGGKIGGLLLVAAVCKADLAFSIIIYF